MPRRPQTIGKRIQRFGASNSLARAGRRIRKRAVRKGKRLAKKTKRLAIRGAKAANRFDKRLDKKQRRILKRLPGQLRKGKRKLKRLKKAFTRRAKISRKLFKKLAKPFQLRGQQLKARRAEARQEIKGTFDTSRSVIVKASEDPGASKPGEPPKKRSGEGWYSIKAEVRRRGKTIISRTYVDKKIAPYMAMWEFRTDGQQRPFLKPGLMNNLKDFQTRVGAELKRAATTAGGRKKAVNK